MPIVKSVKTQFQLLSFITAMTTGVVAYAAETDDVTPKVTESTSFLDIPFSERITVHASLGYGFSLPSTSLEAQVLLKPSDSVYADYLEAVDIKYSQNTATISIASAIHFTENFSALLSLPYGIVDQPASETLPGLVDYSSGMGDYTIGMGYRILKESESVPEISIIYSMNSDTSDYTSLGDGLKGQTLSLSAKKYFNDNIYGFGQLGLTQRQKKGVVEPGDIQSAQLGFGMLMSSGQMKVDMSLRYVDVAETTIVGSGSLGNQDNLSLLMGIRSASEKLSVEMYLSGLDELEWKSTSVGFRVVYKIWPWE